MRKNVLQLIGSFHQGGSERQAVQLTQLLQDDKTFRVFVGCLDKDGPLQDELDGFDPSEIQEFKLTSFRDVNFVRQVERCARYISINKIDVIHTHDFYTNIFGMCAAYWAGVPGRVASKRETFSKTQTQMLVERQAFRLATRVLANAEAVKTFLIDSGVPENKIAVIYNGIDFVRVASPCHERMERLEVLGFPIDTGIKVVTIVANLRSDVKNHRMFLRMAKQVVDSCPEAVFVIAGEGELTDSLKTFAADLGIRKQIFFVGACRHIGDLLSVSDVCVLTSRSEGFSNAILEYMSAAKPVVATRVGGATEVVVDGESGFLVESDDDAAMADKVITLLQNRELAEKLGAHGLKIIKEKFSLDRQLMETLELYDVVFKNGVSRQIQV
jgi:L-malate glycosyltransferase